MVPSGFLIMVLTVSTALIGSDSQGSMWDSRLINREGQDFRSNTSCYGVRRRWNGTLLFLLPHSSLVMEKKIHGHRALPVVEACGEEKKSSVSCSQKPGVCTQCL